MTSHATPVKSGAEPARGTIAEPATLADIARAAGVSAPTVSKVLNGRADVADSTRARVELLLRDHGYRRRSGPRAAPLLDLVFHELDSPWAIDVVRGAEKVAYEEGLSLVLSAGGRSAPGRSWLDGVLARRPTGVILVLPGLEDFQREQLSLRQIPFAVIDPAGDLGADVPAVGTTNWQGGLAATRHLIELGHRRIGVVAGPGRLLSGMARLGGYRAALESVGLPFDPALVRAGDPPHDAGDGCGGELLRLEDRPTAVFAADDERALGVYLAARELGLRIPEDLSVVGFDDLPAARWAAPPLTTVRRPFAEMAAAAARIVVGLARGDERHQVTTRVELATELVVRGSTAAPAPPEN